jgi:hypothetical protein
MAKTTHLRTADPGMVRSQVVSMVAPPLALRSQVGAPAPMTVPVKTRVVLTGMPKVAAARITTAPMIGRLFPSLAQARRSPIQGPDDPPASNVRAEPDGC